MLFNGREERRHRMVDDYRASILVVDDEEWVRVALSRLLEEQGYTVVAVGDGQEAASAIERGGFDMVILDQKIKSVNGIDLLKHAKAQPYDPEALLLTAYGTVENAVEAIKLGAFDYLTKPLDSKRIILTVEQALERRRLRGEVKNLRKQIGDTYSRKNIIFAGPEMKKVIELIETISRTDSTVLIEGESGTGKEIIARAIHFDGPRSNGPFITVNCGSIPEPLFESELFGHVKGAFTGAAKDKPGLFEEAEGGTILLDEIGDMPLPAQVKLLRVLQSGEIRRVGSNSVNTIDVRTVASTNRDLRPMIEAGSFREDLFYRLNVMPVNVPPLRSRREDIFPLANHFLALFNKKLGKKIMGFRPEALELLMAYHWPGNVRELENLVERTAALVCSDYVTAEELRKCMAMGSAVPGTAAASAASTNSVQAFGADKETFCNARNVLEKEQIRQTLDDCNWDRAAAAAALGMSRTTLWRRMKKFGIENPF